METNQQVAIDVVGLIKALVMEIPTKLINVKST
jgi:hypothetical protein